MPAGPQASSALRDAPERPSPGPPDEQQAARSARAALQRTGASSARQGTLEGHLRGEILEQTSRSSTRARPGEVQSSAGTARSRVAIGETGGRSTPGELAQHQTQWTSGPCMPGTRSRAGPADARSSMQVEAALQARASRRGARPTALREAVRVAAGRAVIGPSDSRGSTRAPVPSSRRGITSQAAVRVLVDRSTWGKDF